MVVKNGYYIQWKEHKFIVTYIFKYRVSRTIIDQQYFSTEFSSTYILVSQFSLKQFRLLRILRVGLFIFFEIKGNSWLPNNRQFTYLFFFCSTHVYTNKYTIHLQTITFFQMLVYKITRFIAIKNIVFEKPF